MLLFSPLRARDWISAKKTEATAGWKTDKLPSESALRDSSKPKVAETRLRGGMASRQGGSFNSILGRRKSPLASPSSEQQRARGKNLRGKKHTVINVSGLTFLVPGRPTAPGCLCLWGTLFCVGGRPPSLSFFRYFICQIIAAATLSHSNRTPAQPDDSTEHGPGGRGGARPDWRCLQPMRGRRLP